MEFLLNQNPSLISQGVGIIEEKLYNTCVYIGRKLSPDKELTTEEINEISRLILEKCLASYPKPS